MVCFFLLFFLISTRAGSVNTLTVPKIVSLSVEMCWFLPNLSLQDPCGRCLGKVQEPGMVFLYDRLNSIR